MGLECILETSFFLNPLFKGPIVKYSPILRSWAARVSTYEFGKWHNWVHNKHFHHIYYCPCSIYFLSLDLRCTHPPAHTHTQRHTHTQMELSITSQVSDFGFRSGYPTWIHHWETLSPQEYLDLRRSTNDYQLQKETFFTDCSCVEILVNR